jgi:hypothetical protein
MKGRGLTPACVQNQKGKEVKEVFILYFFPFFYFFDFVVKNLAAQGIEAVSFFAGGKKDTSG